MKALCIIAVLLFLVCVMLFAWALCVAASEADARIEIMLREKK